MRCYNCKGDHKTVKEARVCAGLPADHRQTPDWNTDDHVPAATRHREDFNNLLDEVNRIGAQIEPGKYAIRNGSKAANNVSMYSVERTDVGKWAGKTFLKQILGGVGADGRKERVPAARAVQVLSKIAADPMNAMILFGKTSKVCGRCGIRLTNERSRDRGLGDDCASALGYTDVA